MMQMLMPVELVWGFLAISTRTSVLKMQRMQQPL